jgi:hypothetical protein
MSRLNTNPVDISADYDLLDEIEDLKGDKKNDPDAEMSARKKPPARVVRTQEAVPFNDFNFCITIKIQKSDVHAWIEPSQEFVLKNHRLCLKDDPDLKNLDKFIDDNFPVNEGNKVIADRQKQDKGYATSFIIKKIADNSSGVSPVYYENTLSPRRVIIIQYLKC